MSEIPDINVESVEDGKDYQCNFCFKSDKEVRVTVCSPFRDACICNECIEIAQAAVAGIVEIAEKKEKPMSRYKDRHLYGTTLSRPSKPGDWLPIGGNPVKRHVLTWGPLIPRTRFMDDRPWRYRPGGEPKPWTRRYERGE